MRGDILGFERRRRWSDDDKIGIVGSVGVDRATVTQVAQRHDVTRQQIYAWRHELKKKGFGPSEGGNRIKTEGAMFCKSANRGKNWRQHSQQNDRTRAARVRTNRII